jgi:uncharacterized protein
LGIEEDEKFVIVRFVSRSAVHDIGSKGLALAMKRQVVEAFSKYARVFISSEQALPEDLRGYQLPCSPEKIHDALYYADLLYGESATMASEAACVGTPAIFVDDKGRLVAKVQEAGVPVPGTFYPDTVSPENVPLRFPVLTRGRGIISGPCAAGR